MRHVLFVGDSFTHGRYVPVRTYGAGRSAGATDASPLVVDENEGQTGARAELEPGPWGGIPGIFARLADEAGMMADVHIEAISETSLTKNYAAASSVIVSPSWDVVVLQELSTRPLPQALSMDTTSDPPEFCSIVKTIEAAVHAAAPAARIYLYETWPRADLAASLSGGTTSATFATSYPQNLARLADANHDVYLGAASRDGHVAGVALVGDAWSAAWDAGVASPNPYATGAVLPSLWYGLNAVNDPAITAPDDLHPSIYGAYLSGLVLFQRITGSDVRAFGAAEQASVTLGIAGPVAAALQQVAWSTVTAENGTLNDPSTDPCAQP